MPSMRAPRITRIRRCSSSSASWSGDSVVWSATVAVQVLIESFCETAEQGAQRGEVAVGPTHQQALEPRTPGHPDPIDGAASGRREADPHRTTIVRVDPPSDQLLPFELLDLASYRRGIDTEQVGEVRDPECVPSGHQFEEEGCTGSVDPHPGSPEEALMQARVGNGPGHAMQGILELVDERSGPGLARC